VIAELANIPMVNGYVFVKWKLLSGGDNAGVTARSLPFFSFSFFVLNLSSAVRTKIQKHTVVWTHEVVMEITMNTVKETAVLQSCLAQFSVRLVCRSPKFPTSAHNSLPFHLDRFQETNGGKDFDKIGKVQVDLAEYAGSKPTTRKFLLLESRLNSTLEVCASFKMTAANKRSIGSLHTLTPLSSRYLCGRRLETPPFGST